jgi:hypothetical protein
MFLDNLFGSSTQISTTFEELVSKKCTKNNKCKYYKYTGKANKYTGNRRKRNITRKNCLGIVRKKIGVGSMEYFDKLRGSYMVYYTLNKTTGEHKAFFAKLPKSNKDHKDNKEMMKFI